MSATFRKTSLITLNLCYSVGASTHVQRVLRHSIKKKTWWKPGCTDFHLREAHKNLDLPDWVCNFLGPNHFRGLTTEGRVDGMAQA